MSSGGFLDDVDEDEAKEAEMVESEVADEEASTVERDAPVPDSENSLVKPVDNIDAVVGIYEQFDEIKENLLDDADVQTINTGRGKQKFVTKSGWRKIATAFNLSVDIVNKEKEISDGVMIWRVEARATAPNGKTVTSWSSCSSNESNHMEKFQQGKDEVQNRDDVFKVDGKYRRLKPPKEVAEHNIITTAETRAKNRAISDLVGGGDVSAEEITKEDVLGDDE
jgi:hypothetical protein